MPAVVPFDFSPAAAAAINDLSCRFLNGLGVRSGRVPGDACTQFPGDFPLDHFVDASSRIQFCGQMNTPLGFAPGDTTVAARIRDVDGNLSDVARIVIRVLTP